jgi:hypothetical protein
MNKFANIDESFLLKDDYDPKKESDSDVLTDSLKKRRKRHADSFLPKPEDQFPREVDEDKKTSI